MCPSCSQRQHIRTCSLDARSKGQPRPLPLREVWQAAEKLLWHARQAGRVDLVHLVCFVHLVGLVQPNKPDRPNKQERPAGPRVSRGTAGGAEVSNDESRVCDGVGGEGGLVLTGHRGAQSLGCLANGKREGFVLLNLPEMLHGIPAPLRTRKSG